MKKEKQEMANLIQDDQNTNKKISLTGLTNSTAKAYFFLKNASLYQNKKVILWCVRDEQEKKEIIDSIKFWQKEFKLNMPIFKLPIKDYTLYDWLLKNKFLIIVAKPEEILKKTPSPHQFRNNMIRLKTGLGISPSKLSQWLIEVNYRFDDFASSPGSFSRKGGILDIFPQNFKNPIKIEFFGNKISSIKAFHIKTKKIIKNLKSIEIIPESLNSVLEDSDLFDYLNYPQVKSKEDKNSGQILFVYADIELLLKSTPLWQEVENKVRHYQHLTFNSLKKSEDLELDLHQPNLYQNNFKKLVEDLKKYQAQDFNTTIATNKKRSIIELLKEFKIKADLEIVKLLSDNLRGFISKKSRRLFLTDYEIFGRKPEKDQVLRRRVNFSLIYELKTGDYIVHLDHGVGRFNGIIHQKINSIEKEYFSLTYAENDKLFIPIEYAEKISKYIGHAKPKLNRLSGTSWLQLTHKVRKSAEQTAQHLLKLYARKNTLKASPLKKYPQEEEELASSFPFTETEDQKKAILEVMSDLEKEEAMDRLICGDVGFGKTEVAIRAAFRAVLNHKQVILLSPTTILTQQHIDTFKSRLKSFKTRIVLLSRVQTQKEQNETLAKIKSGEADIVIGTHRLLSKDVRFNDLGLIIIDEEQRFGVKDKEKLREARVQAHVLTLTATPIPRTLNFSLSGLRDISIIQTPPFGRRSIETSILHHSDKIIKEVVEKELDRAGQIYFLHNRVETINLKANLLKKLIPKVKIGVAHGRMKEKELMEEMRKFDNQQTNLLVCSTIIENGLDLPNVNTLIVENATHFGLADLYQLRGRIGRSFKKAFAYFLYQSKKINEKAKRRLQALLEVKELGAGFELALRDLEIRGAGNILGHEQSGHIKAIGLNLYLRLMNQAIKEIKTGKKQRPIREVNIDLPVNIGIPKEMIPEEAKRLKIYQELASIYEIADLLEYKKSFRKKYDYLPPTLENLFNILVLKIWSQKTKVSSIVASKINIDGIQKERLVVNFIEKLNLEQFKKLLKINHHWQLSEDQIKIDKNKLGQDWLQNLIKCVKVFI